MEDKILCNVSDLKPIAEAVREKENTNKLYSVEELKVKIPELIGSSGGTNIGDSLDRLNTINGGTAATTIGAAVDNTEAIASSQENLIAQIASALEGKAGSSTGSGIDTCTVTIEYKPTYTYMAFTRARYSTLDNGSIIYNNFEPEYDPGEKTITLNNIVCNTLISIECEMYNNTVSFSGDIEPVSPSDYEYTYMFDVIATGTSGGTITIA